MSTSLKISPKSIIKLNQHQFLREGMIVKGKVVQVSGSKIILQIGHFKLEAETKIPLKSGEVLQLLVEKLKKDFVKLKVVPEGTEIKPETILLARLGIRAEDDLEKAVYQLLKFKMPVTEELLKELKNFLHSKSLSSKFLPVLVWLKSVGIEIETKEDFVQLSNVYKFLQGDLHENEEKMFFKFLNHTESIILNGYNIYGTKINHHYLYLLTDKPKGEKITAESSTLILKVRSKRFGELWFKITYLKNNLQLTLNCENVELQKFLQREIPFLQNSLQTAGYQVNKITIEAKKIATVLDFIPGSFYQVKGIDITI